MDTAPPQMQMVRLLSAPGFAQAIYVAAKLGIADLLSAGPRSADELATATKTHARSLYRLLRTLASGGVFAEDGARRFALTPLAECLRADVPGSQRGMALAWGEVFSRAWAELLYSIQTGEVAFEKAFGLPLFAYLGQHPEHARLFTETMAGAHGQETEAMLQVFDLAGVGVLADVGGGDGSALAATLLRYPRMRGILFDLPEVAERARVNLAGAGLADRCRVIGGDFFRSVPDGADTYLLRHVVHDWDDERAVSILQNTSRAMGRAGRLLVVESLLPPGNDGPLLKLLDLSMLVMPGGEERTEEEYRALFARAGLELTRVVMTQAGVSLLEGKRR